MSREFRPMTDAEIDQALDATTPEQWAELEADLRELERSDPAVMEARTRLDAVLARIARAAALEQPTECVLCHNAAAGHDRCVPIDHDCADHQGIVDCDECSGDPR